MVALLVGSTLNGDLESKLTHRQVDSDQTHESKLVHKQRLVILLVFLRPVYVFLAFTRLVTLQNQGHAKKVICCILFKERNTYVYRQMCHE